MGDPSLGCVPAAAGGRHFNQRLLQQEISKGEVRSAGRCPLLPSVVEIGGATGEPVFSSSSM
ncbi:hypothetical protein NFI96_012936, partial [Prochilodus magdalenae]